MHRALVDVVVDGLMIAIVSHCLLAGVVCCGHPRILTNNDLSGNIPESIGNLQNLEKL